MDALRAWRRALDLHVQMYGRPPSFDGELDEYHRDLFRVWVAAEDVLGMANGLGTLSAILQEAATEIAAFVEAYRREVRQAELNAMTAYFAAMYGQDE